MHGQPVSVEARLRNHCDYVAGLGIKGNDGTLEFAERIPGSLLHHRINRELNRRTGNRVTT